jgi:hypothetical protein
MNWREKGRTAVGACAGGGHRLAFIVYLGPNGHDSMCHLRMKSVRPTPGPLLSLSGEHVRVAGVLVAPSQIGVQGAGLDVVVAVVGVGDRELPQRPEVGLDRIGPRRISRREAQLDPILLRPAPDHVALVGGEVVQDDVDRGAIWAGSAD